MADRYTAEEVVSAIKETQGLLALAADKLGCSVRTIYNYRDRYATVREAITQTKERRKDITEGKLWQQIQEGNITAIIFYLKTQAKDRGYVERQEVTGKDGEELAVKLAWGDHADAND